jgi:hypothetical protein
LWVRFATAEFYQFLVDGWMCKLLAVLLSALSAAVLLGVCFVVCRNHLSRRVSAMMDFIALTQRVSTAMLIRRAPRPDISSVNGRRGFAPTGDLTKSDPASSGTNPGLAIEYD